MACQEGAVYLGTPEIQVGDALDEDGRHSPQVGSRVALGPEINGIKAVVRDIDHQVLGTVGDRYHLIQNHEAFAPLQYAIDEFGARIETAGALGIGDRVWMLIKLATGINALTDEQPLQEVVPGDIIEPYFLVTNAHTRERSQSLLAKFTPVRVVCQNTLDAALGATASTQLSIRHTASAEERVMEIRNLISYMSRAYDQSMMLYQKMQEIDLNDNEILSYIYAIWPLPTDAMLEDLGITREEYKPSEQLARDHVLWLVEHGHGSELVGKTLWGVYNAITEYVDHVSVMRKDGKKKQNGSLTAIFGAGASIKSRAMEYAADVVQLTTRASELAY